MKNKIIVLLLTISMVLVNCFNAFASSPYAYEDLPDFPTRYYKEYKRNEFILLKLNDTQYKLIRILCAEGADVYGYDEFQSNFGCNMTVLKNRLIDDYLTCTVGDTDWAVGSSGVNSIETSQIVYSSINIYTDNTLSGLLFPQKTPQLAVLQEVEMMKATTELIGVVPLVIGLMVSWVALRKGYQWLLTRLRQA